MTQALVLSVLGYWATDHQKFNVQVLADARPFSFQRSGAPIASVDDYLKRVLYVGEGVEAAVQGVPFKTDPRGADLPTERPTESRKLAGWNEYGGLWEDGFVDMGEATQWGGLRAPNHFHDPLASGSGGYTGIKTETGFTAKWRTTKSGKPVLDLFRPGASVTDWVEGGSATERNEWGYPAISTGFVEYFTKLILEERERALATALRSLGQVEHLITDNTVPDHARDLAHPGQGFEEYLHDVNGWMFGGTPRPWPQFPLKRIEASGLRRVGKIGIQVKSRPDTIDPEIVQALKQLGCYRVFLGVDSNSVKGLKALGRGIRGPQNHVALGVLLKADIHVTFNLLAFEPDCTLEDLTDNIDFIGEWLQVPLNLARTEIYGGTRLEEKLQARGALLGDMYGYDYVMNDARSQRAYEMYRVVLRERCFTGDGANLRAMAIDCIHQVLTHFWPERCTPQLRGQVKGLIRRINQGNLELVATFPHSWLRRTVSPPCSSVKSGGLVNCVRRSSSRRSPQRGHPVSASSWSSGRR